MTTISIVSNPKIFGGKPIIAGTRISVELVLDLLSAGWTYDQIRSDYDLKKEELQAALDYARKAVAMTKVIPL